MVQHVRSRLNSQMIRPLHYWYLWQRFRAPSSKYQNVFCKYQHYILIMAGTYLLVSVDGQVASKPLLNCEKVHHRLPVYFFDAALDSGPHVRALSPTHQIDLQYLRRQIFQIHFVVGVWQNPDLIFAAVVLRSAISSISGVFLWIFFSSNFIFSLYLDP